MADKPNNPSSSSSSVETSVGAQERLRALMEFAKKRAQQWDSDALARDLLKVADELKSLLLSAGCVCTVDDGLVREWVQKARAVAKSKGYLLSAPLQEKMQEQDNQVAPVSHSVSVSNEHPERERR
jgi:hypothetical protein